MFRAPRSLAAGAALSVLSLAAWIMPAVLLSGCPSRGPGSSPQSGGGESSGGGAATIETTPASTGPLFDDELLANPLEGLELPDLPTEKVDRESFAAPATLEELLAAHEWEAGRMADGVEVLAEAKPEQPAIAPDKAVGMPNDSKEDNDKLREAFGVFPESDSEIDYDGELTLHFSADAKTTNPLLLSSMYDQDLIGFYSFGILGFDYQLRAFAPKDVVSEWKIATDQMVDVFTLRDDLTWSDGEPITAYDIVFSYETIMDEEIPIPAVRSGTDELVDVVAYDERTVAFFHEAPKATNLLNIAFPVIPQHVYSKTVPSDKTLVNSPEHVRLEANPPSGGPYVLESRKIDQETVLVRRESWYMHEGKQVRPKPRFARIRCKVISDVNTALLALKSGQLDYMLLTPEQWSEQTNADDEYYQRCTKLYDTAWSYSTCMFNLESPVLKDRAVRRAIALAFDHKEYLETVCYGLYEAGQGPFHPASWYAPEPAPGPIVQDLDRAEEMLREAGWADTDGDAILDKDGRKLEFTVLYGTGSVTSERIAALLRDSLEPIGVIVNPKSTEFTVIQQKARDGDFDGIVMGWGTGADPDSAKNIWMTGEPRNFTRLSNSAIDSLFERGLYEFDREKRGRLYARIGEILWHEHPALYFSYRSEFVGLSNELRGVSFSPRGMIGYSGGFEGLWKPKQK